MSEIYKKSISQQYGRYFEQIGGLIDKFKSYSIDEGIISSRKEERFWERGSAGVPLAWFPDKRKVLVDHTDSHTLVIGPTGSKKTRLVAMPLIRILANKEKRESMIISDPKAELYNRSASYLQDNGYHIVVINFRSPLYGDCWNPLSIPYDFFCKGNIDRAYEFVNDIAENLIYANMSTREPFWDNSAGSLFYGLTLLLFRYCKEHHLENSYVHIGNVIYLRNLLFSQSSGKMRTDLWNYAKQDTIISSALIGTVETAKETRSGILSTFDQKIRIFSIQPSLLDLLSRTTFDLSKIDQIPMAIYLILPDEKTGYHNLASLFIKQSYEYIIFSAQQKAGEDSFITGTLENRLNYILDEFSSLPTVKDFPAMITAARSRNIRFTLFIQSKHQIIQRYKEEAETIQTNCNNWIFLTSRELKLLNELSNLCGYVYKNSRPLLSIAELQHLDKDTGEALLLTGRSLPYITHLPDINEYDRGHYKNRVIKSRKINDAPLIDIGDNEVGQLTDLQKELSEFSPKEIDKMIEEIDKKIAELEITESGEK